MQANKILAEQKHLNRNKLIRDCAVSIPFSADVKNTCAKTVPNTEMELQTLYSGSNTLMEIWNEQHPIINTWLLLSSISICFLFAVFFII